jgi:D-glycero-alpha-D-manno-heptose-7-phosphate kinase
MIITKTPLRISIGGGGTDLPSYYKEFGGFVISAAINRYVYIAVSRPFFPGYFMRYSETEHAETLDAVRHPLLREALRYHDIPAQLEVVSVADVPAGTGMGSSGSFLVGLLHALHAYKRAPVIAETLAREAFEIEANRLHSPVGRQDHYIAAYGGIICQEYRSDDSVQITPLKLTEPVLWELRDTLRLFFVGSTRQAATLLHDQKTRAEQRDQAMLDNLHFTKELGREIRTALEEGNVARYGKLMHEHWMRKRTRSPGMSNGRIDELYEWALRKGGATGGKLVGAGGSGFLLLHAPDSRRLRQAMAEAGLREIDFSFDFDGSVVLLREH